MKRRAREIKGDAPFVSHGWAGLPIRKNDRNVNAPVLQYAAQPTGKLSVMRVRYGYAIYE
jgi:hypothetical protein